MTYKPSIRSALLGLVATIAALLIGITSSSATAATHANAQQSHPIAATHATETQPLPRNPAQPCPLNEPVGIGYPVQLYTTLPFFASFANIYNGPSSGCMPVAKVPPGGWVVVYYNSSWGYSYVTYGFYGGWINNQDINFAASGIGSLPIAAFGGGVSKLCTMSNPKCHALR